MDLPDLFPPSGFSSHNGLGLTPFLFWAWGNHGSEVFCVLNLLAFVFHPILGRCDEDYRQIRASERRLDEFFNILRTALRLVLHESWRDFMWYATGYDGEPPG